MIGGWSQHVLTASSARLECGCRLSGDLLHNAHPDNRPQAHGDPPASTDLDNTSDHLGGPRNALSNQGCDAAALLLGYSTNVQPHTR